MKFNKKKNKLILLLLFKSLSPPLRVRRETTPRRKEQGSKKSKEKGIEIWKKKPPTSTLTVDALRGKEEQIGEKKKTEERQGAGLQPKYPATFGRLLRLTEMVR